MFFKVATLAILLCSWVESSKSDSESSDCREILFFWNKRLEKVPEFAHNPCVKDLDLHENRIVKVDKGALENLPNLEKLNLVFNKIQVANLFSFGSLPKLKDLFLSSQRPDPQSEVTEIVIDVPYPNLESLHLSDVGATKVSAKNWPTLLPKLTMLVLSLNPDFDASDLMKNFPPTVKFLNLLGNHARFLNLTNLDSLNEVILDGNDFKSLHITDRSMTCQSDNQLCIGSMKGLRELSVSNCGIEEISSEFVSSNPLPSLKKLELWGNKLKTLGDLQHKMLSLEELNLGDNEFQSVENLCGFRNLGILDLGFNKNPISLVLSKDVDECLPNLRELRLYANNLTEIPKKFFGKLNKLQKLDLSENQLKRFPNVVSKTLRNLKLFGNQIKRREDLELGELKELDVIEL